MKHSRMFAGTLSFSAGALVLLEYAFGSDQSASVGLTGGVLALAGVVLFATDRDNPFRQTGGKHRA